MKKKSVKAQIESLSASLEEISVKRTEWAIDKHKAYIEKHIEDYSKKGRRCFRSDMLFSALEYEGDWQIHRVFLSSLCVTQRQTRYDLNFFEEVSQYYFNVVTHEEHFMMRPLSIMGKTWNLFEPMRYRKFVPYSNAEYASRAYGDKIINSKIHPLLQRNGISLDKLSYFDKQNLDYRLLFKLVTTKPFYETLIKSNQWKVALFGFTTEAERKAMLLNLRFGIDISSLSKQDVTLWKDSINLMESVGIDWHNPKILADWKHQHDVAVKKKEKLDEIKELEKIPSMENDFATSHKKYLGIEFEQCGLFFHSLNSVKEYYDEGKAMHHCVYAMRYFLKKDVVIFSIRDENNQRLATLEYDVKRKEIVQCRAVCNKKPERYDDMVEIFKSNEWRLNPRRKKQALANAA